MKKLFWIIPLALVLLIQVFPVNRPANKEDNSADFILSAVVPDNIANLLRTSCYDCHSMQTVYPWYSYVAPMSWLVVRDVSAGREQLNFSNWDSISSMQKAKWISGIIDEISEDEMPLSIYTLMHPNSKLTKNERKAMIDWATAMGESLFE